MANASSWLGEASLRRVEERIAALERATSAEVTIAVATESGRYDRAESILGAALALAGACLPVMWQHGFVLDAGAWGLAHPAPLGWQAVGLVVGTVAGQVIASHVHPLRRLLTSRREMQMEVESAAMTVFARARMASARRAGGVLLYVSLYEQQIMVLADQAATAALGGDGIATVRDAALGEIRDGRAEAALLRAIERLEERLKSSMPPVAEPGELPNKILLFHPRP